MSTSPRRRPSCTRCSRSIGAAPPRDRSARIGGTPTTYHLRTRPGLPPGRTGPDGDRSRPRRTTPLIPSIHNVDAGQTRGDPRSSPVISAAGQRPAAVEPVVDSCSHQRAAPRPEIVSTAATRTRTGTWRRAVISGCCSDSQAGVVAEQIRSERPSRGHHQVTPAVTEPHVRRHGRHVTSSPALPLPRSGRRGCLRHDPLPNQALEVSKRLPSERSAHRAMRPSPLLRARQGALAPSRHREPIRRSALACWRTTPRSPPPITGADLQGRTSRSQH